MAGGLWVQLVFNSIFVSSGLAVLNLDQIFTAHTTLNIWPPTQRAAPHTPGTRDGQKRGRVDLNVNTSAITASHYNSIVITSMITSHLCDFHLHSLRFHFRSQFGFNVLSRRMIAFSLFLSPLSCSVKQHLDSFHERWPPPGARQETNKSSIQMNPESERKAITVSL